MSAYIVEGGRKLSGSIRVSGNKNEALPVIAASLACKSRVTLNNLPDIGDVRKMLSIAHALGCRVSALRSNSAVIDSSPSLKSQLPLELSAAIRGSILFASSLLIRTGKAILPQPGGDTIGRRRLDTHFLVFKALGAKLKIIEQKAGSKKGAITYVLEAPKGLRGGHIYLDETSVTATENALIAASGARSRTVIANAASEPHVQGLCRLLQAMGVTIEGVGSNVLTVTPAKHSAEPLSHTLGCDYIEAGSLIGLAAATGSSFAVTNVDIDSMRMILFQFSRLGITVKADRKKATIHVPARQSMRIRKDLGNAIPKIEDSPWPGFPADLTSIMLVLATQAKGTCLIHEKLFESRLFFVDTLISMGAQIVLCDPHRAVVVGPSQLHAATITSPDIRAGMALLLAALAAKGTSIIHNIAQIDRGYERIDKRLGALGARIKRHKERRKH